MAPSSRKAADLKAKEARQKKILAVGAVVLAILLVVQVPKLLRSGSSAPAAAPATTTTAAGAAAAPVAASLADTDVAPTPDEGQLVQFDIFESKDPFVQQVKDVADATAAPATTTTTPAAPPASVVPVPTETTGSYTTTAPPPVPKTSVARIAVGGKVGTVVAGAAFPADAPAFRLVSFTAEKAEISVVGGSFQSGAPTLTLEKGVKLTLENTADGTRFVLLYRGAAKVPTDSLPTTTTATATTEG
jgi:hypothetical protein